MGRFQYWLEGVRLWVGGSRRSIVAVAAGGAGLATLVLLGSTVAAPLLTGPASRPATTSAALTPSAAPGAGAPHRHAGQRSHGNGTGGGGGHSAASHRTAAGRPHHRHGGGSGPAPRSRGPFTPPSGKIFHGVSDTSSYADFAGFAKQVGSHPAVLEDFYHWDTPLTTGALKRWRRTHTRGVLSLSTAPGGQPELITPRQIANGVDDHYLLRLNQSIANSRQVVYIRLFPEMNGYWNPYSAYDRNGTPRDSAHSPESFRRAWQRVALIVRGGKRPEINRQLRQRGMPRLLRASSNHDPVYRAENVHRALARPKVAFMWTPLLVGSPSVAGNQPADYWPGKAFVDWVGSDLYSKYASGGAWSALTRLYRTYHGLPFAIGEYSPWDNDKSGSFTRRLFHWAESHHRVGMMLFYRSIASQTQYSLDHWPQAKRVIRHELNKPRFASQVSVAGHRHHARH